jgi:hypothetical protein
MLMEFGDGGRTRTYDLRIMSSKPPAVDKEDKELTSANPAKSCKIRNPRATKNTQLSSQNCENNKGGMATNAAPTQKPARVSASFTIQPRHRTAREPDAPEV